MQQRRKPRPSIPPCCLVHPSESVPPGHPALRPDLGPLTRDPLELAASLHASRCLRRFHQYYQPIRLPTSARRRAVVLPRATPPTVTIPPDPVGSPGFQCRPFVRDTVLDPGGATPPRASGDAHAAFVQTNALGLHDYDAFGADLLHPARLLSTLRTHRYRCARKTRFSPARYDFGGEGLAPPCQHQLCPAHSPSIRTWDTRFPGRTSHFLAAARYSEHSIRRLSCPVGRDRDASTSPV